MGRPAVKVATFTVAATAAQSARWKQSAHAEGHASVGTWLAEAADRHLEAVRRAGKPVPLGWRRGRFDVTLSTGQRVNVKGSVSQPFAFYRGPDDRYDRYNDLFTLIFLPADRIVASLRSAAQARALASELAAALLRGELPDAGQIVGRHVRESV
jgi:hypothetical protein